jgi:hypothetical protein
LLGVEFAPGHVFAAAGVRYNKIGPDRSCGRTALGQVACRDKGNEDLPMNHRLVLLASLVGAVVSGLRAGRGEDTAGPLVLAAGQSRMALGRASGAILGFAQAGRRGSLFRCGQEGLWHVRFQDGRELAASEFSRDSQERQFRQTVEAETRTTTMTYRSAEIEVVVTARARNDGFDLSAELSVPPGHSAVVDFSLPARLRFGTEGLERLVCPGDGNQSVGMAFLGGFFQRQPEPTRWTSHTVGSQGYEALYGGGLAMRADQDPPVPLRLTDQGRTWLGAAMAGRVASAKATVNRAPQGPRADLVLVDSEHGPYFSASRLGGRGRLWRFGGGIHPPEAELVMALFSAVVDRLAADRPADRDKIGLIALRGGPAAGNWSSIRVGQWLDLLRRSAAVRSGKVKLVELRSAGQVRQSQASGEFLAILNPYGEWLPVEKKGGMPAAVRAIGRYVRHGGNWFETGGYPFFSELVPADSYYQYDLTYPPAFADFFHLETASGTAAVYRIQPRTWEPWQGARDPRCMFVPGRLGCGGDERGGWCDRSFAVFVGGGQRWRSPVVRLAAGGSAGEDLRAYCRASAIQRRLEDKMSPEVLRKFKSSVMLYYAGDCREKTAQLGLLPVPTQIHFADYLHGGFDKQYPDHLPPRADFGTPREFRAFIDRAHGLGHLVMPYTNPTWWCDGPKGPTFQRYGEAPLLTGFDGRPSFEQYEKNTGYTVCHWHPAVRAANRKTVEQFHGEYPIDVLFQDQCGARGWQYDTNPASPTPCAYAEGLVSMVDEDSRTVPLSTEGGWDRVVNAESQLCGMTWSIVPTEGQPVWTQRMSDRYAPATWELFPLAQYVAHDKTAMIHHDLGQFVTNRQVLAWTLGLGFSMSCHAAAAGLGHPGPHEWLRWLDRVQKSIAARYVGQPVGGFRHDRGPPPGAEGDGAIRAQYGPVRLVANLDPQPRREADLELAPFGFAATAPGLVAANLRSLGGLDFGEEGISFVAEGNGSTGEVWVYAPANQEVAVLLPAKTSGGVKLSLDGAGVVSTSVRGGAHLFRLPSRPHEQPVEPPPGLSGKAPRDWPGPRPAVAVLDFGSAVSLTWTRISPQDWLRALGESRLAREHGVPIRRLAGIEELQAALRSGPTAYLAIVNPYGEAFPAAAQGKWREGLERIRHYVRHGGWWWETGGHSFHSAVSQDGGRWQWEAVGPQGAGSLGLPVGGGDVDQPPETLSVTAEGRAWLGPDLCGRIAASASTVNRALVRGHDDPGHITLVTGQDQDFIGAYRLDGWGWLWRIGGFYPHPNVALPVAAAAMEYLYTHAPPPLPPGGLRYLWHASMRGE